MRLLPALFLLVFVGVLAACRQSPPCPHITSPLPAANAGCLIVSGGQLVMVRELSGAISLPGGTSAAGESSQCTAFRETWEETGLQVTVHERVAVLGTGFDLFRCTSTQSPATPLVPAVRSETPAAYWISPDQFDDYRFRFPDQRALLERAVRDSRSENP